MCDGAETIVNEYGTQAHDDITTPMSDAFTHSLFKKELIKIAQRRYLSSLSSCFLLKQK